MLRRVLDSLNNLQCVDNEKRKEAEKYIINESEGNFVGVINSLLDILVDPSVGTIGDTVTAGVVLKTLFSWESEEKRHEVNMKWTSLTEKERDELKGKLISSLGGCTGNIGEILGQCLGAVARIEVVSKRWPEVFSDLSSIGVNTDSEIVRINIMETIGILCMDTTGMDERLILHSSGFILTVLIKGANSENPSTQKSAFKNLDRCLEFISHNISIENECLLVMETLFNACRSSDEDVACLALRCYTGTLFMYYNKVIKYVSLAFGNIAMNYMYSEGEDKILAAIEMWGAIAEHEMYSDGEIISEVFSTLVGQCMVLAMNSDMEQTEEWVPHKASAWLLGLVTHCAPERVNGNIVNKSFSAPHNLISAIESFITSQETVKFEAGMIVLGSILNTETVTPLNPLIKRIAPLVFHSLGSDNPVVLDTGMWLLERLFKYAYVAVEQCHLENDIIRKIMKIITMNTEMSVTAAWTLTGIAGAVRSQSTSDAYRDHAIFTNFTMILDSLVRTFFSLHETQFTLKVSLSSAIAEVIKAAIPTYYEEVIGFLNEIIAKVKNELVQQELNEENISCYMNLIQACISTCFSDQISNVSKEVVSICIFIIHRSKLVSLYTEAYLTLSLLADRIGIDFGNYTEEIIPFIIRDMRMFCCEEGKEQNSSLFATSLIMFIGSMAMSIQLGFSAYIDQIVPVLIRAVISPHLPRETKTTAISTFSDISLSVGKMFDRYLNEIMEICMGAIKVKDDGSDSGFILTLRESLLVLLSCIVQASDGRSTEVINSVERMLLIVKIIAQETTDSACIIKSLYLLSDLWILCGSYQNSSVISALESPWVFEFISAKTESSVKEVRDAAISTRLQISYINKE
ncbi:importin subunit beta-1 [Nematocida parisii]|nr:importin subunit beta-1 [Nematocida parisii]